MLTSRFQRLPSNNSQSVNIPSGLEGVPLSLIHRVHMKEAAAREAAAVIGTRQSVQDDLYVYLFFKNAKNNAGVEIWNPFQISWY
jgi:hypothetical protein